MGHTLGGGLQVHQKEYVRTYKAVVRRLVGSFVKEGTSEGAYEALDAETKFEKYKKFLIFLFGVKGPKPQRHRHTDTHTDTHADTHTQHTHRHTQTQTHTDTDTHRHTDTHPDTQTHTDTQHTQTHTDTHRHTQTQTHTEQFCSQ